LRTVGLLAVSSFAVNASRAFGAVLMRMVLDPVAVGVVNGLMLFGTMMTPLTTGSIYGAIRALPGTAEEQRPQLVRRAFSASAIEALIVSLLIGPAVLPLVVPIGFGSALFWLALALTITARLLAVQESILVARGQFDLAVKTRLLRSLEPVTGMGGALISATPFGYLAGAGLSGIASLALRRQSYFPPGVGFQGFWREGWAQLRKVDGYNIRVALDRITANVANYLDAAVVVWLAGPASLAGYYLGVNIRGAMNNIPNAVFWQRWSSSVTAFDASGVDRYAHPRFLLQLWSAMLVCLALALVALWVVVKWVIPDYLPHFRVAAVASLISLPISITAMLRGRRMMDRRVGALVIFSLIRIAIFLGGLLLVRKLGRTVDPEVIAIASYVAVAFECMINSADIALHVRRPRLFLLVTVLAWVPVGAFPLLLHWLPLSG
jgi:hypothetical protein